LFNPASGFILSCMMRHPLAVPASLLVGFLATALPLCASLSLPAVYSDGMVLQRDRPVLFHGKAEPGAAVRVSLADDVVEALAGQEGTWEVRQAGPPAGGAPTVSVFDDSKEVVLQDVYFGEVWLAGGQSNMAMPLGEVPEPMSSFKADPLLRSFLVPRRADLRAAPENGTVPEAWIPFDPANAARMGISAVGYAFAAELRAKLDVPVGLIQCNWGATAAEAWVDRSVLESHPRWKAALEESERQTALKSDSDWRAEYDAFLAKRTAFQQAMQAWRTAGQQGPKPQLPDEPATGPYSRRKPGNLYRSMLQTAAPYTLRGFLFYQGEANAAHASDYTELLGKLIGNWRTLWRDEAMPFYFVQLASRGEAKAEFPALREAQRRTALTVPATGMAVSLDLSDVDDIHPKNKLPIGRRLASLALNKTYSVPTPCIGPQVREVAAAGGKTLKVTFQDTGDGLRAGPSGIVSGFRVLDAAGKDFAAHATLAGPDTVAVEIPADIPSPAGLRYAWEDFPDPPVNLANSHDLPAYPFSLPLDPASRGWQAREDEFLK
jgi:sialate O-acetylesterase